MNMARLTIYKDSKNNTTPVNNRFIDEFMEGANDVQLKVYLYLLRMLGANQATSVSDLADKFNHTEREIIRALKYWEKQKLLTLDYAADGIPVGIHFRDLDTELVAESKRRSSTSQSLAMFMEPSAVPKQSDYTSSDYEPEPEPEPTVTAAYEKPRYSASDISAFKNREETAQIMFIAESYIGKPLTPAEMKSLLFLTDVLQFSVDLIDYLIAYCVERDKKDFKYIERVAINWAENNVTTPAQAKRFSRKYDKNVYAIMNALGKTNTPTNKEAEFITRWTGEYGFDMDIILEACERTVLATDRHRLEYADRILSSWHQEHVQKKADIHKIDELYQQKKASSRSSAKQAGNGETKFNHASKNSYDFDTLEKQFLSN